MKKKLLIISNNPLSRTNNNGKTIYSFINDLENVDIFQLYFSGENPSISGFSYYQLSDIDILRGYFNKSKRGREVESILDTNEKEIINNSRIKTIFFRILREIVWKNHWKSMNLIRWLDKVNPDIILFIAGDSGFAYNIVDYVVKRYNPTLYTYITDDYIMERKKESFLEKVRRNYIKKKMINNILKSKEYFTISQMMMNCYYEMTRKKSIILTNMTPSIYVKEWRKEINYRNKIRFFYAGNLYYGRDKIIANISDAVSDYNKSIRKDLIEIDIYTPTQIDERTKNVVTKNDCCKYKGSLNELELKVEINGADVLLFVESFEEDMIEKTKFSFSTKITEYLSAEKPIFCVGPKEISSIDYLKDVSFCATSTDEIYEVICEMLSSHDNMKIMARKAREKFEKYHDVDNQKKVFVETCGLS